jgi:general secretion pathway protein A
MYREYFRISENPFSITPDPRFLFMGRHHREAMAHLLYGMSESGGFVQLTGEVGTGKTTLCRALLERVPEEVDVALILNPKQTALELVASVCDELHIPYPPGTQSIKALIDLLNRYLLDSHGKGRRTVLIFDEAQNLSTEVLEQIRLLTNLETTKEKLLQILLIGQPELRTLLARPELRQLAQRITARYHLIPLLPKETAAYIRHRLEVVGLKQQIFARGAVRLVHRLSGGVPRLVNIICDRAMLGAYAQHRDRIGRKLVRKAATEVTGQRERPKYRTVPGWAVACLLAVVLGAGWSLWPLAFLQEWMTGPEKHEEVRMSASVSKPVVTDAPPPVMEEKPIEETGSPGAPETVVTEEIQPQPEEERNGRKPDVVSGSRRLAELLQSGTVKTDTQMAFLTLFRQWELSYPDLSGARACDRAAAAGLSCLYRRGNWTNLRLYNRPAVLELIDDAGRRHHVTVVALEGKEVTLDFAGEALTLPRAEVGEYWFGSFILLWKPPPFSARLLAKGSTGPEVIWLREQLNRAEGLPGESEEMSLSPRFDEILRKRVMNFQLTRGLKSDGLVGEQTLIQLNTVIGDPSVPVLFSQPQ